MAIDSSAAAPAVGHVASVPADGAPAASPPAASAPASSAKYRLRFAKTGDLRLVSHIDLLHCFERLLRRAALPFASTQGFHPKPKIVFAQALALGVVGENEVVEIELEPGGAASLASEELLARLNRQAKTGIRHTQN